VFSQSSGHLGRGKSMAVRAEPAQVVPSLEVSAREPLRGRIPGRVQTERRDDLLAIRNAAVRLSPGNIRELRNVVERAMIVSKGPRLTIPLPSRPGTALRRERAREILYDRESRRQLSQGRT
jgi:hypothetical protein